jgi:hypothetical protein
MRRWGMLTLLLALAGCNPGHGERCNPNEFSDIPNQGNCQIGFSCVYPTSPGCGVAFCCTVDANGKITDSNPNCQPDPTLAPVCELDIGATPTDAGRD